MTVFLSHTESGNVFVQARAEGPGGMIGDLSREIKPGGDFYGIPFEKLKAMGEGRQELKFDEADDA